MSQISQQQNYNFYQEDRFCCLPEIPMDFFDKGNKEVLPKCAPPSPPPTHAVCVLLPLTFLIATSYIPSYYRDKSEMKERREDFKERKKFHYTGAKYSPASEVHEEAHARRERYEPRRSKGQLLEQQDKVNET